VRHTAECAPLEITMIRAIFVLLAALWTAPLQEQNGYSGPNCFGPFCLDRAVPIQTAVRQLGTPPLRNSEFGPFCYTHADGKSFLFLDTLAHDSETIGSLLLSDFPNCLHAPVQITRDDLLAWETRQEIGLNSSENDVVNAYGTEFYKEALLQTDENMMKFLIRGYRPDDKSPPIGEYTISYSGAEDDLRLAEFCIRSGKVSCIFLSRNE
jgi:hypothetical protein